MGLSLQCLEVCNSKGYRVDVSFSQLLLAVGVMFSYYLGKEKVGRVDECQKTY